jgi:hypothetical protein
MIPSMALRLRRKTSQVDYKQRRCGDASTLMTAGHDRWDFVFSAACEEEHYDIFADNTQTSG